MQCARNTIAILFKCKSHMHSALALAAFVDFLNETKWFCPFVREYFDSILYVWWVDWFCGNPYRFTRKPTVTGTSNCDKNGKKRPDHWWRHRSLPLINLFDVIVIIINFRRMRSLFGESNMSAWVRAPLNGIRLCASKLNRHHEFGICNGWLFLFGTVHV